MTSEQFILEYTKLYRFFYPTLKPNDEQMSEYYNFLKYINYNVFQTVCSRIKQSEENLPRNLVAYCKNAENGLDELIGELSRGANKPPDAWQKTKCYSCQDTGFIGLSIYIDHETGQKREKIYEPSDRGYIQVAKKCLCSEGQKMGKSAISATQRECIESAKMNGGHIHFSGEAPF